MSEPRQESIIVDAWAVVDGNQQEFLDELTEMFNYLSELDGFLEGQILEGVDPTRFVTFTRMRSAQAREAVMLDGQVQATLRRLGGIAHPNLAAYTVFRTFTPRAS